MLILGVYFILYYLKFIPNILKLSLKSKRFSFSKKKLITMILKQLNTKFGIIKDKFGNINFKFLFIYMIK